MRLIVLALALVALAAQEPAPYPDGAYCTPKGDLVNGLQTPDHPCACHRIDRDPTCEGRPIEDAICKQYCTPSHCGCEIHCEAPER